MRGSYRTPDSCVEWDTHEYEQMKIYSAFGLKLFVRNSAFIIFILVIPLILSIDFIVDADVAVMVDIETAERM